MFDKEFEIQYVETDGLKERQKAVKKEWRKKEGEEFCSGRGAINHLAAALRCELFGMLHISILHNCSGSGASDESRSRQVNAVNYFSARTERGSREAEQTGR